MKVYLEGVISQEGAARIERATNSLRDVKLAEVDIADRSMDVDLWDDGDAQMVFLEIRTIVEKYEPDIIATLFGINRETEQKSAPMRRPEESHTAPKRSQEREISAKKPVAKATAQTTKKKKAVAQEHSYIYSTAAVSGMQLWIRFCLGVAMVFIAPIVPDQTLQLLLPIAAYIAFGYDVLWRAAKKLSQGRVFDESLFISLATILAIGIGQLQAAALAMLFYRIGEALQSIAVQKSRKSIAALLQLRPDYADRISDSGTVQIMPEQVHVGDVLLVKAGERIPLDGVLEEGSALIHTEALTGDPLPRMIGAGGEVLCGYVNGDRNIKIRVTKLFGETALMKIMSLVERAVGQRSQTERTVTRFARTYTAVVICLAAAVAILPTALGHGTFSLWLGRAVILIAAACPGALLLSAPLAYFSGIDTASKNGILVKSGSSMDTLCDLKKIVFDMTGILTKGRFTATKIKAEDEAEILYLAALGEADSSHPIATAIMRRFRDTKQKLEENVSGLQEMGGYGISYFLGKEKVLLGNHRLMARMRIRYEPYEGLGTVIYVARDDTYKGYIVVEDTLRDGCRQALTKLRHMGITTLAMLTGDRNANAEAVAAELGLNEFFAELLPADKLTRLKELVKGKKHEKNEKEENSGKTAFVGDGIYDAPLLAAADLGIVMGGIGSPAATKAANVVLMDYDISRLADALRIAKNTRSSVQQNVILAMCVKLAVLVTAAMGTITLWMAALADMIVVAIAIWNAIRKK